MFKYRFFNAAQLKRVDVVTLRTYPEIILSFNGTLRNVMMAAAK